MDGGKNLPANNFIIIILSLIIRQNAFVSRFCVLSNNSYLIQDVIRIINCIFS
jgi:hypothetical protein